MDEKYNLAEGAVDSDKEYDDDDADDDDENGDDDCGSGGRSKDQE
jgi:hypothetical protein